MPVACFITAFQGDKRLAIKNPLVKCPTPASNFVNLGANGSKPNSAIALDCKTISKAVPASLASCAAIL